jgi:ribonuclease HII
MVMILGCDEAGRGPVIGSLMLAGVMVEESKLEQLKQLGVKDSKLLTHPKRIKLAEDIKRLIDDYKIIVASPQEIDEAVKSESKHMNLNWLEAHKIAQMVNELQPDKVYLDCPSPNIKKFVSYLRELIDDPNVEIIAEHKADVTYPIVSAASILAKVKREEEVHAIEQMTGQSIGSGYPSNPICQKFLKENWEKYPDIFRKSWVSWKDHQAAQAQKTLGEFEKQFNKEHD